jgi:hypothetical protein
MNSKLKRNKRTHSCPEIGKKKAASKMYSEMRHEQQAAHSFFGEKAGFFSTRKSIRANLSGSITNSHHI